MLKHHHLDRQTPDPRLSNGRRWRAGGAARLVWWRLSRSVARPRPGKARPPGGALVARATAGKHAHPLSPPSSQHTSSHSQSHHPLITTQQHPLNPLPPPHRNHSLHSKNHTPVAQATHIPASHHKPPIVLCNMAGNIMPSYPIYRVGAEDVKTTKKMIPDSSYYRQQHISSRWRILPINA